MSAKNIAKRIGNILDNILDYGKNEPFNDFFSMLKKNDHLLMWDDICKMKKGETIKLLEPQLYDTVTTYKHDNCDKFYDDPDELFPEPGNLIDNGKKRETFFTNSNGQVVTGTGNDEWIKLDRIGDITELLDDFESKMDKKYGAKDNDNQKRRKGRKKKTQRKSSKKAPKNGTKKGTRKGSTRKGPEQSATQYKIGTVKIGLDGNKWIIKENKNGVHRWVKK